MSKPLWTDYDIIELFPSQIDATLSPGEVIAWLKQMRDDYEAALRQPMPMPEGVPNEYWRNVAGNIEYMVDAIDEVMAQEPDAIAARYVVQDALPLIRQLNATPQPAPAVGKDAPDDTGWWAFEGRYTEGITTFQSVFRVWEESGRLLVNVGDGSIQLHYFVGKWWPLSMPWDKESGDE